MGGPCHQPFLHEIAAARVGSTGPQAKMWGAGAGPAALGVEAGPSSMCQSQLRSKEYTPLELWALKVFDRQMVSLELFCATGIFSELVTEKSF